MQNSAKDHHIDLLCSKHSENPTGAHNSPSGAQSQKRKESADNREVKFKQRKCAVG